MKAIYFLLVILIMACGQPAETAPAANNSENSVAMQAAQEAPSAPAPTVTQTEPPKRGHGAADIKINIDGIDSGESLLIGFSGEQHYKADSAQIVNGSVRFQNPEGYVQGIYYASTPNNEFIQMVLSFDQKFELTTATGDLINGTKVQGSTENEVFYQNLVFENGFNSQFQPLNEKIKGMANGSAEHQAAMAERTRLEASRKKHLETMFKNHPDLLFTKFKKAGQNPEIRQDLPDDQKVSAYRNAFWDNVDFSDKRLLRTPVIFNKLKRYIKELTPQNHDSIFRATKALVDKTLQHPDYYQFFTNWIALEYEPTKCTLMDPEYVFVNMVQNYFTRERAFWADSMQVYALQNRALEMKNSVLGIKGPNVTANGPDGKPYSIDDINSEYLVVYLYNPTCEHCMVQTPLLVEWEKQNPNASVYAIVLDTNEQEWTNYIKEKGMERFTNVFDPTNRSIYAKYYVDVTPEIYVLNKERTIIGKNLKVNQIDIVINKDKNR